MFTLVLLVLAFFVGAVTWAMKLPKLPLALLLLYVVYRLLKRKYK